MSSSSGIFGHFLLEPDPSKTYEFLGWNSFKKACETSDRRTKFTFLELLNGYPDLVMKEISSKQEAFEIASAIAKTLGRDNYFPEPKLDRSRRDRADLLLGSQRRSSRPEHRKHGQQGFFALPIHQHRGGDQASDPL
jgi:hypothetical protein